MSFSFQTLRGFMKKEFRQILRDPRMRSVLFIAPIIQMTLFGFALSTDIQNVRLAAPARQNDPIVRHIYEHALASGFFIPAKASYGNPYALIKSGDADAVLIAPSGGLTRAMGRGDGELQLVVNASNVMKAQGVEAYLKSIMQSVVQHDLGLAAPKLPIRFDIRILYNPSLRTAVFEVPAVMGILSCLTTIIFTAMSISREKEQGTFEMLISSPASVTEIILGKTVPFVALGLANLPLILGVAVFVFGVPMRGSIFALVLSALTFVCVTVAVGTFISTISETQQQSMMGGFLFLFPAIQLSGMMFPLENMPSYMKFLAYINPLTYYLENLRCIMLKGDDWHLILTNLGILVVMAMVLITISFRRFRTTLG